MVTFSSFQSSLKSLQHPARTEILSPRIFLKYGGQKEKRPGEHYEIAIIKIAPVKFMGVLKFTRLMKHTAKNSCGSFRAWLREALLQRKGVIKKNPWWLWVLTKMECWMESLFSLETFTSLQIFSVTLWELFLDKN